MPRRMNTSYFAAAAVGLVILAGHAPAQQAEKADGPRAVALLLDTFKIVEGRYSLDARGNYVRAGKGTHVIPAASVLFVGTSRDHVAKYLAGRADAESKPTAKLAPGDFNSVAAKAFPTKVQPILTNLCATCHAKPDYAGTFKLKAVPAGFADADAARANAVAALVHIDRVNPSASDLLAKCVAAHGGQKLPACRDRAHPAYATLELWAHGMTLAEGTPIPKTVPTVKPPQPPAVLVAAKVTPPPAGKMPTTAGPTDPFDPREFNAAAGAKK